MWRRDENNPRHIAPTFKDEGLPDQRLTFRREFGLRRQCAEEVAPNFVTAGVSDHEAAKNAAHAMADQNNLAVIREGFV
jgi:hypothetical protein